MKKIITTLMLISTFLTITAHAIDQKFTYQGELTDGGSPANGTYDIAIQAFDAAEFGSTVGSVSIHNTVTVSNGLFAIDDVDLGIATFDGLDIWLQISVKKPADASFTNLSPLQKMTSVPYATTLIDKGASNGQVLTFNNASGWQPVTPTNTQLTETQVDNFVANNGYVNTSDTTAWDKNIADDFDGVFSSLTGVPAGLADGDDDTQLNETQVDGFVANNGYVSTSDTTAWDKNAADDFNGNYDFLTNKPFSISTVNKHIAKGGFATGFTFDDYIMAVGSDFDSDKGAAGFWNYIDFFKFNESSATPEVNRLGRIRVVEQFSGSSFNFSSVGDLVFSKIISDLVSHTRLIIDGGTGDIKIYKNLEVLGNTIQDIDSGGMVKFMVQANCGSSGSTINRKFNGTTTAGTISIANGGTAGRCTLTFPTDIDTRFWVTSPAIDANRSANCKINSTNKLNCRAFIPDTGAGVTAQITVIVY